MASKVPNIVITENVFTEIFVSIFCSWKIAPKVPTIVITGSMFIEISASKEILENLHSQVNLKTKNLIKIILNVLLRVIGGDGSVEENFDVVIGISFCRSPSYWRSLLLLKIDVIINIC